MNRIQSFNQFLATQTITIPIATFIVNLLLTAVLAYLLSLVYWKYGSSLSNRRVFGKNFVIIAMTTMIVITIVKSSLALSLGLVGALSIVRFRAAIKEPEELGYLFLCIAIGLGFGADQGAITLVGFIIVTIALFLSKRFTRKQENENLFISISTKNHKDETINNITDILSKNCQAINLRRFDDTADIADFTFLINLDGFDQLKAIRSALKKLAEVEKVTFLDNKNLF